MFVIIYCDPNCCVEPKSTILFILRSRFSYRKSTNIGQQLIEHITVIEIQSFYRIKMDKTFQRNA